MIIFSVTEYNKNCYINVVKIKENANKSKQISKGTFKGGEKGN